MRCKVLKPKGSIVLRYASTAKNPFDEQTNRVFAQGFPQVMLEYTVVSSSASACEVHYDVTRLITLSEHLNKPLDEASLRELLGQVKIMLDTCLSLHLPLKNVVLDVNQVYYDSWTRMLRFIYLPFQGVAPDAKKMRAFFEKLIAKVRPADEGAACVAAAYRSYVQGSAALDPVAFSAWLENVRSGKPLDAAPAAPAHAAHAIRSDYGQGAAPVQADPMAGRTIRDRPKSAVHSKIRDRSELDRGSDEPGVNGNDDGNTTVLDECSASAKDALDGGALPSGKVRGKHASMPLATGVLNALDWDALSRGERLQLLGEDGLEQPASEAPASGALQETTVLDDLEERPEPASEPAPVPKPNPTPVPAPAPEPVDAKTRFWLIRRRTGERVQLKGDRFVVGKSMYSSYQVRNTTTVSRSHAVFCCAGDCCRIEDADSRNGTFVNGERLAAHVSRDLADGDAVRMSDEDFVFEVERVGA